MMKKFTLFLTLLITLGLFTIPNQVKSQVSSYPYTQTWQSGTSGWSLGSGGPYWSRRNTSTSSSATGPNAGTNGSTGSHVGGNYYVYLETSTSSGSAYLTGPQFDLSGRMNADITFWYHMYGSNMGTLKLQVYNGSSWVDVWSKSGQQHSSQSSNWTQATVSLASFSGTIQIRYHGIRGSSFRSDMAVDLITVDSDPAVGFDVALERIVSPEVFKADTNWLKVEYQNKKADTINWFDLGYMVDWGTPILVNNIHDTLFPAESGTYTFTTPIDLTNKAGSHNIRIWINNANDSMPDNDPSNDTLIVNMCTGMAGTYTIGATGDYPDFNAAVAALQNCGVVGPVTFNVQQGSYTERVVIPAIVGMDATNTVTFDGQDKDDVTLTYGGTSSTNRTTLIFDGGDYFTFKNMTIKNTGSTYAVAILYTNQAEYNEVSSCNIEVNSSYTSWWTTAIMASASESSSSGSYGNNANFNLIKNNNITGGYCGINFRGVSTQTSAVGNQYIGNTITGQYYYAIYHYYQSADVIQYNNIDIGSRNSNAYAIYRYYSHGAIIDGNIINPGRYGMYLYRENYAYYYGSDTTMITNNMMYDFHSTSYQQGLYSNWSEGLKIYHNTIAVDGSYANNYNYSALYFYYTYAPIIKNNILISTGGTMLITSYYYFYSNATIDYNDYIYPNRTTNMFFTYNRYYADLTAWKTASMRINMPHDVNSMENVDPHFVSTTDFHLDASYPPLKGVALGLTTDVDGDARCIYETTLGADESTYPVSPPNAEFIADDTVCFGTPITFINTAAKDAKQGYWWYHNGVFKTNDLHYTTTFGAGTYSDTISLTVEN
ncbi:MAG: hypothetical protein U9R42_13895, partial [Bacteroidota bacterium]|nr:hypothetical protein [Bacteroidota bacterium]